jgi:hypothetical protein
MLDPKTDMPYCEPQEEDVSLLDRRLRQPWGLRDTVVCKYLTKPPCCLLRGTENLAVPKGLLWLCLPSWLGNFRGDAKRP